MNLLDEVKAASAVPAPKAAEKPTQAAKPAAAASLPPAIDCHPKSRDLAGRHRLLQSSREALGAAQHSAARHIRRSTNL